MTRLECEKKILAKLEEIEQIFNEYGASNHLSMFICDGYISAYAFDEDQTTYVLNTTRYSDGRACYSGDQHD